MSLVVFMLLFGPFLKFLVLAFRICVHAADKCVSDQVLLFQGPVGVAGLKGGRGTQGAPVR